MVKHNNSSDNISDNTRSNNNKKIKKTNSFIVPDNYVEYVDGTENHNYNENDIKKHFTNKSKKKKNKKDSEKYKIQQLINWNFDIPVKKIYTDSECDSDYDSDVVKNKKDEDKDSDIIDYTSDEEKYLKKLSEKDRELITKEEKKILDLKKNDKPWRFKILSSSLDTKTKSSILEKLDQFYYMESSDPEYHKLNKWISGLMEVPFDKYSTSNQPLQSNTSQIRTYLNNCKQILDKAIYGHNTAKNEIIQYLANKLSNPKSKGKVLAIQGPMGNGKTTLVKKGIAKSLNKPFGFIALGGASDSSFLEGHDFTYEGSQEGKIIKIIKKCGTMDPVIFCDELDKLSDTPKGEEISNLLCHMIDHSQNDEFYDRYYNEIPFNLSQITFIFSFNNIEKINPILLDRIHIIKTKGFNKEDKIKIANNYLLPEIYEDIGFPSDKLKWDDSIFINIINNYTKEEGVRNLKRRLETIVSKLNILRLLDNPNTNIVNFSIEGLKFPLTITNNIINKLLSDSREDVNPSLNMLYT